MRRERLTKICVCVTFIIMLCFFFPAVVNICFSHEWVDCLRIIWPFMVAISISQYILLKCRKGKKSEWWAILGFIVIVWTFKVLSDNWYIRAKNNELSEQSYLISTGRKCRTHKEPGLPRGMSGDTWNYFSSFQFGIANQALAIGRQAELSDTVLLKISLTHNLQKVIAFSPTPAEIQKYMEPVLFIDGVEQPRPEYDDLNLSDEERCNLLRKHHLSAVRVIKKEHDKFLRNLVTLQVNDTIQKTVNLMYKDEPDFEDIFDSLNEDSYVIVKVSDINPKVIEVVDWMPTSDEVEKYTVKSFIMIATIISKKKEDAKQGKHTQLYYAKLRINDKLETGFLRVRGLFQSDRQEYESLKVGDTVMIKMTEGKKKSVSVLNWQPTHEEIEKYRTPVRLKERKQ